ncbi:unnamed protein product [Hymenolepis diminuta]|uniref:Protein kinase domain-containing protein n=1 Tax=Hymenolepis diminuta TaxID=6216 RepID=A0A0R3SLJ7_HYMDI|nr:unnamed protein product [Hymenolepis diminuta]
MSFSYSFYDAPSKRLRLLAANIQCPLIATLYHRFLIHDTPVLVMSMMSDKRPSSFCHSLSEEAGRFYIAEIMCALEELHQLQIVHLDSKPANVCLQNSGHILLADFYRSADLTTEGHLTYIRNISIIQEFFKGGEELNFRDFLKKVARFRKPSSNGVTEYNNREAKLQFLFGMYDLDMDNKISRSELLSVLQMMVGASVTMDQINRIGERTMAEADVNGDGYITYEEFKTVCFFF